MDSVELRKLLQQPRENAKLEFKSRVEFEGQGKTQKWNEFIKDIIALTNGNIGTANEKGYLIIGAANELEDDGTRNFYDVGEIRLTDKQISDKVSTFCEPPIQNLDCEIVHRTSTPLPTPCLQKKEVGRMRANLASNSG